VKDGKEEAELALLQEEHSPPSHCFYFHHHSAQAVNAVFVRRTRMSQAGGI